MDFFLEIHNGECGLGEHFCDQVRFPGPSVLTPHQLVSHQETVSTQAEVKTQNPGRGNEQGECTLLIKRPLA